MGRRNDTRHVLLAHTRDAMKRFVLNWIPYWEGVILYWLGGFWWALIFFGAWSLVAIGFHLSKWKRLSARATI